MSMLTLALALLSAAALPAAYDHSTAPRIVVLNALPLETTPEALLLVLASGLSLGLAVSLVKA